jgi:dynein heavy chain 2
VGSIKKENIDEIRSLKMPPDAIRDVLEVGWSLIAVMA